MKKRNEGNELSWVIAVYKKKKKEQAKVEKLNGNGKPDTPCIYDYETVR